jgi:hypothetical protein
VSISSPDPLLMDTLLHDTFMPLRRITCCTALILILVPWGRSVAAQAPLDSAHSAAPAVADSSRPYWQTRVRFGSSGPSVGSPPSAYDGKAPPDKWCLSPADTVSAHTAADYSGTSQRWTMREWTDATLPSLESILSDTSGSGDTLRLVYGKAPRIDKSEAIEFVSDEKLCRAAAEILNRDLLGWKVGPPPVALLRVHHYLFAYPSRTQLGEWGLAAGMDEKLTIRGVGTW